MPEHPLTELSREFPFFRGPATVQIQSVLYNNDLEGIDRSITSLARSAELAQAAGVCFHVILRYGDSSPSPCLSPAQIERWSQPHKKYLTIEYDFFAANLGSARGHNRLAKMSTSDFFLIQNPDVIQSPRLLETLLEVFRQPGIGLVEAKQVPIEHPKDYDVSTGETSWASTACALVPASLFRHVGGFDAESFFLYCDDVDFSWSIRRAGFKVIYQPAAMVFHDKRLSTTGGWQTSAAERYYSAEAALFLTHKWSRPDLTDKYLTYFSSCKEEHLNKAAEAFKRKRDTNELAKPVDNEHQIGEFVDFQYAKHRFVV